MELLLARALVLLLAVSPFTLLAQSYFQQQVDYRINVRLDDVKHELHASEEFDYWNNSPQALDTMWIHLWPNAYKDQSTALCEQLDHQNGFGLHFATPDKRGFIDSLDFRSNGAKLSWGFHPQHIDIGWIKLPTPLSPGGRITISTPFHVKIPSASFSRLGHAGQAYYITQWFPKPAVFDPQGWHAMPYLTQGEFYSEFGSFDVSITLPANYVVGATGELQTATEVAWLDSMAASGDAMTQAARGSSRPEASAAMKTIRYTQDKVHDFAWFADKRFIVQKGSVTLPRSGHTVTTWTMFTPKYAKVWGDAITYVNESVRLYSEWIGDYPYSACTATDGGTAAGGGMEYPMITIINRTTDPFELDVVIAHEVGHNWFYGMLASNERDHPWMDEGINSFYEQRYVETRYPDKRIMDLQGIPLGFLTRHKGITYRQQNELQYRFNARRNWDSPLASPSTDFAMLDYGTTVYSKGALVMEQLQISAGKWFLFSWPGATFGEKCADQTGSTDLVSCLGATVLDSLMQGYFQAWCFKHPGPDALAQALNALPGLELGTELQRLVLTSDKVEVHRGQTVGKLGWPRPAPLDIDTRNDVRFGLRPPEVKFLAGLEPRTRRSIYWTPVVGKNAHDGWMPGLVLHNTTFPSQRFEWVAAPLYGTKSERLAGGARFMWHHDRLRSDWFRNIHVGVSGFAASLWSVENVEQWYQRAVPSIQFDLRSRPTAAQTDLRFRTVVLWQNLATNHYTGQEKLVSADPYQDIFYEGSLHHQRKTGLHPFDIRLTSLNHEAFNRLSLDATWSAIYDRHAHRVTFRSFGGTFLNKDPAQMTPTMGWRMHWGSSDLLYDHLFMDRQYVGQNTSVQFAKDQGGFKTPTAAGTSGSWIAALNMEADFPFRLPMSFFASYGAAPTTSRDMYGNTKTSWAGNWEAGIGVRLVRDMVEMWIPLAYSPEIKDEIETQRGFDFAERIRFVFALERMDPTQALRKAPH